MAAHSRLIAILAVLFATARIVATYSVYNHTSDEPAHIACGLEWLDKGTYTWEPQHPPLARVATAIGPYLLGIHSHTRVDNKDYTGMMHEGLRILYAGHHYDLTLTRARLGILPFFWIGCLVVFEWGRRYFNPAVAVLAVLVFSFTPLVLAHAGLATTDMALTAFLGAAFLTGMMWLEEPTPLRAAFFGLCAALAILSKFSALPFFPASCGAAALVWFAVERPKTALLLHELKRRLPTLGVAALVCLAVIWAAYRFSFGKVSFAAFPFPAPELFAGIDQVKQHNDRGHFTFFLGHRGYGGWWYFFPVVFLVKTPIACLLLLGVAVYLVARRPLPFKRSWAPLAFAAGVLMVGMAGRINIGLRHVMPMYVGLAIAGGMAAYWLLEQGKDRRWTALAAAALAAWFAGSSLASHPDYLPYFNELAGSHPENIVADSDIDWGQDIKRLSKRLKELGVQEITLGTDYMADFEKEHGIPHRIDKLNVIEPPAGWCAISVSFWKILRLGLWDRYPQYTVWPDLYPPEERIGKGMLLYYFPPRSATR